MIDRLHRLLRPLAVVFLLPAGWAAGVAAQPAPTTAAPAAAMAPRVLACTVCHGKEGRATPDGYFPRIAGKPAGYLANQLLNFRDGRRSYPQMTYLIEHLTDDYLREMAEHFAALDVPYPPPPAPQLATPQPKEPLVPPNPPVFKLPLVPPVAPALLVKELFGVFPPLATIVPKLDCFPLLISAPGPDVTAAPPAPTSIVTEAFGVSVTLESAITSPPPPPAGQ